MAVFFFSDKKIQLRLRVHSGHHSHRFHQHHLHLEANNPWNQFILQEKNKESSKLALFTSCKINSINFTLVALPNPVLPQNNFNKHSKIEFCKHW